MNVKKPKIVFRSQIAKFRKDVVELTFEILDEVMGFALGEVGRRPGPLGISTLIPNPKLFSMTLLPLVLSLLYLMFVLIIPSLGVVDVELASVGRIELVRDSHSVARDADGIVDGGRVLEPHMAEVLLAAHPHLEDVAEGGKHLRDQVGVGVLRDATDKDGLAANGLLPQVGPGGVRIWRVQGRFGGPDNCNNRKWRQRSASILASGLMRSQHFFTTLILSSFNKVSLSLKGTMQRIRL